MMMSETAKLLTLASTFDQRTIGESDVHAWHDVLVLMEFEECAFAVRRHYANETRRIMPADVTRLVRAARYDRRQRANLRALPGPPRDVTYLEDGRPAGAQLARKALAARHQDPIEDDAS